MSEGGPDVRVEKPLLFPSNGIHEAGQLCRGHGFIWAHGFGGLRSVAASGDKLLAGRILGHAGLSHGEMQRTCMSILPSPLRATRIQLWGLTP